jgi:hypothetical protein
VPLVLVACEYPRPPDVAGDDMVDDASPDDGGNVDAMVDAPIDAPPICPGTYATVAGGETNHLYRYINVTGTSVNQNAACYADTANSGSSYLAIPDSATELTAMNTLVTGGVRWWIGVNDAANEGTYKTQKGNTQTFLPWAAGQPDNVPAEGDCVEVSQSNAMFYDNQCLATLTAVCECEEP